MRRRRSIRHKLRQIFQRAEAAFGAADEASVVDEIEELIDSERRRGQRSFANRVIASALSPGSYAEEIRELERRHFEDAEDESLKVRLLKRGLEPA